MIKLMIAMENIMLQKLVNKNHFIKLGLDLLMSYLWYKRIKTMTITALIMIYYLDQIIDTFDNKECSSSYTLSIIQ